jgi:hypothetical protein
MMLISLGYFALFSLAIKAPENELMPVPDHWHEYKDEQTGNYYYHNDESGETTWERPKGGATGAAEPNQSDELPDGVETGPTGDPNARLRDTVCATFKDCMLAKAYCKGPQCIDIEIRLAQLTYRERIDGDAITQLVPLHLKEAEEYTSFFERCPVFDIDTPFDPVQGVVKAQTTNRYYTNRTVEGALAKLYCNEYESINDCVIATHKLIHTIGHDSPIAWVLWNRLGIVWRSSGIALFAMKCFRKALSLRPQQPDIIHNMVRRRLLAAIPRRLH